MESQPRIHPAVDKPLPAVDFDELARRLSAPDCQKGRPEQRQLPGPQLRNRPPEPSEILALRNALRAMAERYLSVPDMRESAKALLHALEVRS